MFSQVTDRGHFNLFQVRFNLFIKDILSAEQTRVKEAAVQHHPHPESDHKTLLTRCFLFLLLLSCVSDHNKALCVDYLICNTSTGQKQLLRHQVSEHELSVHAPFSQEEEEEEEHPDFLQSLAACISGSPCHVSVLVPVR